MSKLTAKQRQFVQAYLAKDFNGAEAYLVVSPHCKDRNVAMAAASRLLRNVKVAAAVEDARKKLASKYDVTADRIVREMAQIAFANAGEYFDWGPGGVKVIEKSKLTREQQAAVAEVSETVTEAGGTIRVKLHDKVQALIQLGKHLDIFKEKHEHTIAFLTEDQRQEELEILIRLIEARPDVDGAREDCESLEEGDGRREGSPEEATA